MYKTSPKSPSFDVHRWQKLDWPLLDPKEYTITKYLGKGSYASVCAAKHIPTGDLVAVKRIDDVFGYAPDAKRILREICILMRLTHPNVVKIRDILEPPADMAQFNDLYIGAEQQPTVTVGHRCGSPSAPCDLMQ